MSVGNPAAKRQIPFRSFVVGLVETVEVLDCCVWWQIVDIHDSGILIPVYGVRI